jgi:nucleotide-binding universal stress UspA family protein
MNATALIHTEGRVLAAIDASLYAKSVADHAAWAATRTGSALSLVYTIERPADPGTHDLSGNLALGGQDALLEELAQLDEQRGRISQARGRQLLAQLAARLAEQHGLRADTGLRQGELVDSLLQVEHDVRLFVIGKRGEHADFAKGHLGSNLERVVRAVHRPVLVASRAFRLPAKFMIAFDGSATTRRCVEIVAASPLLRGLGCELLMVGDDTPAQRAQLQWAESTLVAAGFAPNLQLLQGAADQLIVEAAQRGQVDLIVMGAYGHSRIRQLIVGSTTTHVLRSCQIPMLLLR